MRTVKELWHKSNDHYVSLLAYHDTLGLMTLARHNLSWAHIFGPHCRIPRISWIRNGWTMLEQDVSTKFRSPRLGDRCKEHGNSNEPRQRLKLHGGDAEWCSGMKQTWSCALVFVESWDADWWGRQNGCGRVTVCWLACQATKAMQRSWALF